MTSFRRYFIVIFIALSIPMLTVILGFGWFSFESARRDRAVRIHDELAVDVDDVVHSIKSSMTAFSTFVNSVSPLYALRGELDAFHERWGSSRLFRNGIELAAIYDESGNRIVVAGTQSLQTQLPLSLLIEGQPAISIDESRQMLVLRDNVLSIEGYALGGVVGLVSLSGLLDEKNINVLHESNLEERSAICVSRGINYYRQVYPLKFCVTDDGVRIWQMFDDSHLAVLFSVVAAVAFSVAIGLAWAGASSLSRPIGKIDKMLGAAKRQEYKLYNEIFAGLSARQDEFGRLVKTIENFRITNAELSAEREALGAQAAVGKVASQVAHDIRSPLTALQVIARNVSELDEEKRIMIRNAVQRIDDIANDLANQKEKNSSDESAPKGKEMSVELLSSLIDPLISEKRIQFRSRSDVSITSQFDENTYGLFARVNVIEFKRVLSNLINNAVEAMESPGGVVIRLMRDNSEVLIQVVDNGVGIAPDVLPNLAQRGVSVGKEGGSGLGLYHARVTVESWGGGFCLESSVGHGTAVTLRFTIAPPPNWFVKQLNLRAGEPIVILDDDTSIHQVWSGRFAALNLSNSNITIHSCKTPEQFRVMRDDFVRATYLCDYELLGEQTTGIDLIEELEISQNAILVTSRYAETAVRERCERLGVRILPKGLAGCVPIILSGRDEKAVDDSAIAKKQVHVLVIDDDEGIRLAWQLEKERLGIESIQAYDSMESFKLSRDDVRAVTHAFIDKNIPQSSWSLLRTIQYFKSQGVEKVIVASGENSFVLEAHPDCQDADDVISTKIPQEPAYFS